MHRNLRWQRQHGIFVSAGVVSNDTKQIVQKKHWRETKPGVWERYVGYWQEFSGFEKNKARDVCWWFWGVEVVQNERQIYRNCTKNSRPCISGIVFQKPSKLALVWVNAVIKKKKSLIDVWYSTDQTDLSIILRLKPLILMRFSGSLRFIETGSN